MGISFGIALLLTVVAAGVTLLRDAGTPIVESAATATSNTSRTPPKQKVDQLLATMESQDIEELPSRVQQSWQSVDNPVRDGWLIEHRADRAKQALDRLGQTILAGTSNWRTELLEFFSADCQLAVGLVDQIKRVYDDGDFRIDRAELKPGADAALTNAPASLPAVTSLPAGSMAADPTNAFQAWVNLWARCEETRCEFKIFRALDQAGTLVTHQLVALSGKRGSERIEQHATWITHWEEPAPADLPRIKSLQVIKFEQATYRHGEPLLIDKTAAVLGADQSFQTQLLYGLNHWLQRNQDLRYFSPLGNPGLAVGDVNGDGRDDFYLCQEANLPNRLYLQQPDGTAKDAAAAWRVDWLEGSRSALLLDLDNDGDQDLVVAILGGVVVASNEGDHFNVHDVLTTNDDTTSLSAADYDLDGDLDLYVCVDYPNDFFASTRDVPVQGGAANRIYHDANNAGENSLFRNDSQHGQLRFVDVTDDVGLGVNNRRYSWAACWDDYDNDGDQDLYVANDFGRNNLYVNEQGHFIDQAAAANAEDSASGMSIAWGDANGDGWQDLYISNMFSSAGGRITHQPDFKADAGQQVRGRLQRFARGNTLLLNSDASSGQSELRVFDDVSEDSGVTVGRWAWSSNFVDLNNDGWQDLAVANGYITTDDTSDL